MKTRSRLFRSNTTHLVAIAIALSALFSNLSADPPIDNALRTSCARLNVHPSSEVSGSDAGRAFSYFVDQSDYLFEGYLILGNSAVNLSYATEFGPDNAVPTASNPFGYLIPQTEQMVMDSTSHPGYRSAMGKGYNRDSTIMFDVRWFAAKHPDTCNTFIGEFRFYKGPNGGTVTGLTIAYFADWDVPSDSFNYNYSGADPSRSMIYQRGSFTGGPNNNASRYGALGGLSHKQSIVGAMTLSDATYIYPENGVFENDSIWNRMSILQDGQYSIAPGSADPGAGTGPAIELSSVLVLDRNVTIDSNDTLYYGIVLAGQPEGGSLNGLKAAIDKGYHFAESHNLVPGAFDYCLCGDCDNNGIYTISDAVCMICYIFQGCPPPIPACHGDADGNAILTISDAVYLINYIFAGGPAPGCY